MTSADDTHHISFFKDPFTSTIIRASLTLDELADRILKTVAPNKDKLPWLKMATFGAKRTVPKEGSKSRGSLRHDLNVVNITGCELDYDGEAISFEQGCDYVRAMGIKALVYTSPRHSDRAPRWRILAPTSSPCPNGMRDKLVARMNGFMDCILGNHVESFTLSQAYYYGRSLENANHNHQAVVIDGTYIDLCEELVQYQDKGMVRKDTTAGATGGSNAFEQAADDATAGRKSGPQDHKGKFEEKLAEMGDGEGLGGFNNVLIEAVSSYVGLHDGNPFDIDQLKQLLRDAILAAPKSATRDPREIKRYLSDKYLDQIIGSGIKKYSQSIAVSLSDFVAYMPQHNYIYLPCRDPWPASSVDSRLPAVPKLDRKGAPVVNKKTGVQRTEKPSKWLDKNQPVEQMTWAPGLPTLVKDKLMLDGGWVDHRGVTCLNIYRPPVIVPGNAAGALPWINHIERIYPDDAKHIINFLAHRVQRPEEKINHGLLLGGSQGIGKDTLLEPVKYAVGPWNFCEVAPAAMLGRFNGFLRSVILRISEARDLGEVNRFAFYEHLKTVTAAPPDVLRIDEKNLREHSVLNCCGVIITTNHKTDGLYIPPGDRRTYVAWSDVEKESFSEDYWKNLWKWYWQNGFNDVTAYLKELDISSFNPKAPPLLTEAWHTMVNASRSTEEGELADALDVMLWPEAMTMDQLEDAVTGDLLDWLQDRKNRRAIPHKLEAHGYVPVRNPEVKEGLWKILGRRQVVYGQSKMVLGKQVDAVRRLIKDMETNGNDPKNKSTKSNVHPFSRP